MHTQSMLTVGNKNISMGTYTFADLLNADTLDIKRILHKSFSLEYITSYIERLLSTIVSYISL
jgi:hypothetical protein